MLNSLELFSGAGGLAKGIEIAGANHMAFVEWNTDACKTLRYNYSADLIHETDVRNFNFKQFSGVDLIAGGLPCQPFSMGGKHKGFDDERDMFPYAISAIRQLMPKAFIFENVKELLRKSFAEYFNYIILQLTYPEVSKKTDDWKEHLSELEKVHTKGSYKGLKYNVVFILVNAANYGVPTKKRTGYYRWHTQRPKCVLEFSRRNTFGRYFTMDKVRYARVLGKTRHQTDKNRCFKYGV